MAGPAVAIKDCFEMVFSNEDVAGVCDGCSVQRPVLLSLAENALPLSASCSLGTSKAASAEWKLLMAFSCEDEAGPATAAL